MLVRKGELVFLSNRWLAVSFQEGKNLLMQMMRKSSMPTCLTSINDFIM